jgi:hypothetical protein
LLLLGLLLLGFLGYCYSAARAVATRLLGLFIPCLTEPKLREMSGTEEILSQQVTTLPSLISFKFRLRSARDGIMTQKKANISFLLFIHLNISLLLFILIIF